MKKKLTEYEKNRIANDKEDATIEILLMAFDKPLKYDYTMPSYHEINKMVRAALETVDLPEYMRDKISDLTCACKDEYSKIEFHMFNQHNRFGHEQFYDYHGILYKWRDGEKEKTMKRINKYIPKSDIKYYQRIRAYLRENADRHRSY